VLGVELPIYFVFGESGGAVKRAAILAVFVGGYFVVAIA
jgi:hypothetical protein